MNIILRAELERRGLMRAAERLRQLASAEAQIQLNRRGEIAPPIKACLTLTEPRFLAKAIDDGSLEHAIERLRWLVGGGDNDPPAHAMAQPRLTLRYSPEQPRDDHGRWTSGGGYTQVAGGFTSDDMTKTVSQFASDNCEGRVRRELPGEYLDLTIGEVLALAQSGSASAKKCKKLLERPDYRK